MYDTLKLQPAIALVVMLLILGACTPPAPATQPPATLSTTPTVIACDEMTPVTERGSILPVFTPSYPCELENITRHAVFCMVHVSPTLSYPCTQDESVQEKVIGESSRSQLIQRDYNFNGGCWSSISSEWRTLRACDMSSGKSMTVSDYVRGNPVPSPDSTWFVYVAATGADPAQTHLYRVRRDGTDLNRLDMLPFPQEQVVGAQIKHWSPDGAWVEVSLWDGHEGGWHNYRLRADGRGQYEQMP